jgi:hypothetical protein
MRSHRSFSSAQNEVAGRMIDTTMSADRSFFPVKVGLPPPLIFNRRCLIFYI